MALQRKPLPHGDRLKDRERSLGFLRLHLDDLGDVHRLLSERANDVILVAGNAHADSAEDLKDATRRELNRVEFIAKTPKIVVSLKSMDASARVLKDGEEAAELIEDVKALLEPRRNFAYHFLRIWIGMLALVLLGVAAIFPLGRGIEALIGVQEYTDPLENISATAVLLFLMTLAGTAVIMRKSRSGAYIVPHRRGSARVFSVQARNTWIAIVVSAVVTGLVTWAITYTQFK